jgi:succinoglycan biosynthesis transport protein ExoP
MITDVSLLEIADEKSIQEKMNELKKRFDIIIIEAGALNALNKSKEWIVSADKVVAVFEKDRAIDASGLSGVNYLRNMNGKMLGWIFNKA